jgi:hypothetical protein
MRKPYKGGVLKESIKAQTFELLNQYELDSAEIGYLFGRCRDSTALKKAQPTSTESNTYYSTLQKTASALSQLLEDMPLDAEAEMAEHYRTINRSMFFAAEHAETVGEIALAAKLQTTLEASKAGERNKKEQHFLLYEVSKRLEEKGLKKIKAAEIAAKILITEGFINVPEDGKKAREAITKVHPSV